MDAAPTVTARLSVAICGRSELADRTIDRLAKPASASRAMGLAKDGGGEVGASTS